VIIIHNSPAVVIVGAYDADGVGARNMLDDLNLEWIGRAVSDDDGRYVVERMKELSKNRKKDE
jgi:hypothetical protein